MSNFQKPRGTLDWYGSKMDKFNRIKEILIAFSQFYCLKQIETPTFEHTELFHKSVGETSDIVNKELYVFNDKSNRSLALRPEGTASVVRAYVENKLYANQTDVIKLFYIFNLFRYERPQGGRLREFHQFGVEFLNVHHYLSDAESIIFADNILSVFGLKNLELRINNLGSFQQRKQWIDDLKIYFSKYKDQLSEDSLNRLEKNPLRILDDKVDGEKQFVKNAPKLHKYLSEEDHTYFNNILNVLDTMKIKYVIDDSLVRGLDYYTGVVYEFVSTDPELVGKATLIGGGRYANLIKQTGGPDYEGVGFALGIERLLIALEQANFDFCLTNPADIYVGFESDQIIPQTIKIITMLRNQGWNVNFEPGIYKKDKHAKNAIRQNVKYFIYNTDESAQKQECYLEDMQTKQRKLVKYSDLKTVLRKE